MTANLQLETKSLSAERQALAIEGFFAIMGKWGVENSTARKILGAPAERTFYEWKRGRVAKLPEDTLRRMGYVSGIWKALQTIYSQPEHADGWLKRPNRFFGGQTPLERMAAGDITDLAAVRAYVDS